MKRILSFLLVIVVISAMAVPAFAVDDGYYDFNGVVLPLPDGVTSDMLNGGNGIYVVLYKTPVAYVGYISNIPLEIHEDHLYNSTGFTTSVTTVAYEDNVWTMKTQDYEHGTRFYPAALSGMVTYVWDNYSSNFCDGSTCSLSDINFDDICDTCGMAVAYDLRVTPKTYEFVIKHSDDLTLKYTYTETLAGTVMNAVYDDERITVSFDNPVDHYQYKLVGDDWEEYASYPNTYGSHAMSLSETSSILSSNLVVYDKNGEVFFRNPLWMVMGQVTQGEMENLTAETVGTMKVLVLCGVGLMALLVVLSLFGKRLLIFRS